jgi:hypothetical protein
MREYYAILQDNFGEDEKTDLLNAIMRQEMINNFANTGLPKSVLGVITSYIVDDQSIMNENYPDARDKLKQKKQIPIQRFYSSEIFVQKVKSNIREVEVSPYENSNTNLSVDKYGDVNLFLEKGQTAYSSFQNRLPIAIRHTNKRLAERKETEKQLLLCAEKEGELLFLNDIIPFSNLPIDVQQELIDKYPNENERNALFESDIKHAYEIIFYAYQEAGYRIEVRVGSEDQFRTDIDNKSIKELQKKYPYMTDAKYFENRDKPRFIVPFDQPVLLQRENNYLIFKDYFKLLEEETKIKQAREIQIQKLRGISNEIEKQHDMGYISPQIKDMGNKTCKLEFNIINPNDFQNRINQYHAYLTNKYQKENKRNKSYLDGRKVS